MNDVEILELKERIKEIAEKNCPDYPNIKTIETWEQLYAIDCTMQGADLALKDWQKLVNILKDKFKISKEEIVKIWEKEIYEK